MSRGIVRNPSGYHSKGSTPKDKANNFGKFIKEFGWSGSWQEDPDTGDITLVAKRDNEKIEAYWNNPIPWPEVFYTLGGNRIKCRNISMAAKLAQETPNAERAMRAHRRKSTKGKPKGYLDSYEYKTIHQSVKNTYGRASEYYCVSCNKIAEDWSHEHNTDTGNIANYWPMCRLCHGRYGHFFFKMNAHLRERRRIDGKPRMSSPNGLGPSKALLDYLEDASEDDIASALVGDSITWTSALGGEPQTDRILPRQFKVTANKEGRTIIHFCGDFGFHSVYLDAIVNVS